MVFNKKRDTDGTWWIACQTNFRHFLVLGRMSFSLGSMVPVSLMGTVVPVYGWPWWGQDTDACPMFKQTLVGEQQDSGVSLMDMEKLQVPGAVLC